MWAWWKGVVVVVEIYPPRVGVDEDGVFVFVAGKAMGHRYDGAM
jgi:hypothetical protein